MKMKIKVIRTSNLEGFEREVNEFVNSVGKIHDIKIDMTGLKYFAVIIYYDII